MSVHYFKKSFLNQPFRFNGSAVSFENVGNNVGVRKLDDATEAALVAELNKAADGRRGGVQRVSAEIVDGLKKNSTSSQQSVNRPGVLREIRVHNPESLAPKADGPPKSAVESAGGVLPKPLQTQSEASSAWKPGDPLMTNGPTLEEFIKAGYKAENYPPYGYAPRLANQRPSRAPGDPAPPGTPPIRRAKRSDVEAKVRDAKPATE